MHCKWPPCPSGFRVQAANRQRREAARVKTYLVATGAGLLVGIVYALLGVRSPAPPIVALCELLGILVGEQGRADRTSPRAGTAGAGPLAR
jgi:XapX domain-containing protein